MVPMQLLVLFVFCILYLSFGDILLLENRNEIPIHHFPLLYCLPSYSVSTALKLTRAVNPEVIIENLFYLPLNIMKIFGVRLDDFQIYFKYLLRSLFRSKCPYNWHWNYSTSLLNHLRWLNTVGIVKKCLKLEYQEIINLQQTDNAQHWLPLNVTDWYIITFYFR